jgi:hypothetical protein
VEKSLVDHVSRGELLDLAADDEEIDEAAMRSWGDSRTCRASVIRDILRGRLAANPDPHGLQLRGARITGRIDLDNLTTDVDFELTDCLLEEGLLARDARLFTLVLTGCHLEHPTEPPLAADRLTCSLVFLDEATIIGNSEDGAVRLAGAHIAGPLDCTGASLRNDSGPALAASSLQTGQDISLTGGFTATGNGESGAVNLLGAHVGGTLHCEGASLRNDSGPALAAGSLQVDQDVLLTGDFSATGSGDLGAIRLPGAHIGGQLHCTRAELNNDSGPALHADGLQVDQGMFLRDAFIATGSGDDGAVRLPGAHIGGQLHCTKAELNNDSGPALVADSLQVGQDMYLTDGFWATGNSALPTVSLAGAHIGGQLNCSGAELRNDSGPALWADGLQVDRDMFLREVLRSAVGLGRFGAVGFSATGFGGYGAVRLPSAHIGGGLDCTGAKLHCKEGPALVADGLQVGEDMLLYRQFTATGVVSMVSAHIGGEFHCDWADLRSSGTALNADNLQVGQDMSLADRLTVNGSGKAGAVRLAGAHIGGNLSCTRAELRNDSGPALVANSLQVGQGMYLTDGFTATATAELTVDEEGKYVAVDLTGARVGGVFRFAPERVEHEVDAHRRLAVDGLAYPGVPETGPPWDWLALLRDGTRSYAAQPYQQLAAGYRALGDDRQARHTLMAQRDDQLARTHPRWPEKWWGKITKVTLGYGYQPWRALLFLAAVLALSCVLAVVLGSHGALTQTSNTATPGRSCTVIQQASVGLDLNLPIGKSVARARCDLAKDSASVTAAWLTAAGWVLQLLAWAFAALFIAGFTSAVRKT